MLEYSEIKSTMAELDEEMLSELLEAMMNDDSSRAPEAMAACQEGLSIRIKAVYPSVNVTAALSNVSMLNHRVQMPGHVCITNPVPVRNEGSYFKMCKLSCIHIASFIFMGEKKTPFINIASPELLTPTKPIKITLHPSGGDAIERAYKLFKS